MSFITTVVLKDQEQAKQLQEKAKELGFLKTVGTGAKEDGSTSALLRAICEGRINLSRIGSPIQIFPKKLSE